jgi:hypothetical protein
MRWSCVAMVAGAFAFATTAPVAWAGGYNGPDETKEYHQPCPACPTCPTCAAVTPPEEDQTWFRAELKGGVLMPVGRTSHRIDWGGMVEPTFGFRVWQDLDVEVSYLYANNGVDNPGHQSGSQDMHCFRSGPRINGNVGPLQLYGAFKAGYCNANASHSGFTDNNFVVGPGGGIAFTVMENLQLTAGTDLIWFTGHNVTENTVITPNAGVRFRF